MFKLSFTVSFSKLSIVIIDLQYFSNLRLLNIVIAETQNCLCKILDKSSHAFAIIITLFIFLLSP